MSEWQDYPEIDANTEDPVENLILAFRIEDRAKDAMQAIVPEIKRAGLLPWTFLHDKVFDFPGLQAIEVFRAVNQRR
ncbi:MULTISPECIES: hypothetical protein [unclassified Bradyrhizobium]|uniref:hypothetical protein n=1 Tax=unclassified Bradyrhizobium TaxID=2631580 RepID=UPI003390DBBB